MPSVNPRQEKETTQTTNAVSRQQKTAVIFLAIFALLIIVLGVIKINAQITSPFKFTAKKTDVTAVASTTDLHLKDTDGDGLSDYDEINVYHTSPYLEDSDSDGISDKQEILQGTDPNCPTGQVCNAQETVATSTSIASSSPVDSGTVSLDSGATVTPALLRQILLESGFDKAKLDKISDADIMKSYEEANKNASTSTDATPNGTATGTTTQF